MIKILTLTLFAGLATLVSSFNTHRSIAEDDIERLENNIDRLYIVLEDLSDNTSTPPVTTTSPLEPPSGSISDPDPLSVVWYLGAFGGLIAFFLVVTFSEWCCASKHLYRRHALAAPYLAGYSTESRAPDTPPPPYHLFAPPPYAEATGCEKPTPIFIIPVHQASIQSPPPPPSPTPSIVIPPTTTPAQA